MQIASKCTTKVKTIMKSYALWKEVYINWFKKYNFYTNMSSMKNICGKELHSYPSYTCDNVTYLTGL